jgi:alpha-L-fucosidase 2
MYNWKCIGAIATKVARHGGKKLLSILFSFATICSFSQGASDLKLWFDSPAGKTWENALPVGNGRLGAMVFGNISQETIQLNENTVWSGGPNRNDNPEALASLPELRRLIFDGKQKDAEALANKTIISKKSHGQKFEPVGELLLNFDGHERFSNYYRELNIGKAVAKTIYTIGDVTYTREILASFTDQVIVVRLTASKPNSISFNATFSTHQPRATVKTTQGKELLISGTTTAHEGVDGKVEFEGVARVKQQGGSLSSTDTALVVKNANVATIYISIATNFNSYKDLTGDEHGRAFSYLNKAFSKSFKEIVQRHTSAYQRYYNRVKLDLGTSEASKFPTDVRLKNFRSTIDPELVTLYFQYGRYLLISSSQPGGQPANLQGLWNNKMDAPWDSKYTININAEMNYWPAEKTHLEELHEPFLRMVGELAETGQETARVMYGAKGWMAHHNTDIWRTTGAVDGAFWGCWNGGGGWTSQHLWDHYLYSGDKSFLGSVYPILKGAAVFYVDFLVEHPTKHWLVTNPGMSPENAPKAHQGSSLDAGTTMDNQIVFDVLNNAIRAAEILNKDKSFVDTLRRVRSRLAPMHVGKYGQLQEWLEDIDDPKDDHRHVSHLYGLFPSNQISPYRNPELFSAARTTLIQRGDISTGWSMGWKVNWWARLQDGNHAYKLIQDQLTPVGTNPGGGGTYNNLFDAHPPFQIDGNFGCTSGIAEMLMQSSYDAVHLLPALPDAWPIGRVTGLRAKGGFEIVDMQWNGRQLVKVIIRSTLGGNLRLRVPNTLTSEKGQALIKAAGKNENEFYYLEQVSSPIISPEANLATPAIMETLVYDIPTQPGNEYTFVASKK